MAKKFTKAQQNWKYNVRSGLEDKIQQQLADLEIDGQYESKDNKLKYIVPASNHTYLPDFRLPNGIYIETKGRFRNKAEQDKYIFVKQSNPEIDLRFVFSNADAKIRKNGKMTYASWCEKNNFKYSTKTIPQEWIIE